MITNPPSYRNNVPPAWVCTPRLVLPPDAPTAGYLCGGGGLMTAGFEIALILSLWNIDHEMSDPKLSSAIANATTAELMPSTFAFPMLLGLQVRHWGTECLAYSQLR